MILAIISDIHGNFEALKAVLADIRTSGADRVICLGDCIGYGPEPEQVLSEIMRLKIATILGNHELALNDKAQLTWFNPMARFSLEKSLGMLSRASLGFIKKMPTSLVVKGCRFVHGYPPDSPRTYLFQKKPADLAKTFETLAQRICFVGHTHDLEVVSYNGAAVTRGILRQGPLTLNPDMRYIINIGSVGQPRDGNSAAKYALYDLKDNRLHIRFIAYDIATTAEKIKAAGLPEQHARRLW